MISLSRVGEFASIAASTSSASRVGVAIGTLSRHIKDVRTTRVGSSEMFTGAVFIDEITDRDLPSTMRVNLVRFSPGARTAWHSHALGQTLSVTEGLGRAQARGGDVITIRPGDTIYTPPGEWHWHGAAPDNFMSHLAMWEAPASGAESEWAELVTNDEYMADPGTG